MYRENAIHKTHAKQNQKSIIDNTQKKRKEPKHITKDCHQIIKNKTKEEERNKRELQNNHN